MPHFSMKPSCQVWGSRKSCLWQRCFCRYLPAPARFPPGPETRQRFLPPLLLSLPGLTMKWTEELQIATLAGVQGQSITHPAPQRSEQQEEVLLLEVWNSSTTT